jgi:hypothetical protein
MLRGTRGMPHRGHVQPDDVQHEGEGEEGRREVEEACAGSRKQVSAHVTCRLGDSAQRLPCQKCMPCICDLACQQHSQQDCGGRALTGVHNEVGHALRQLVPLVIHGLRHNHRRSMPWLMPVLQTQGATPSAWHSHASRAVPTESCVIVCHGCPWWLPLSRVGGAERAANP